jgi:tetratricopeptide (TPR) repeat protein
MSHAEASGDEATRAQVELAASSYFGFIGRFEQSLASAERAIEIFDRLGDDTRLGFALAGEGRCFNARAGRLEHSFALADRARQLAAKSDNLSFKSWLAMEAEPNMYKGDWKRVAAIVEQDLPVAWESGNWFVVMYVSSWASLAYLKLDRTADARHIIDAGFDCLESATADTPAGNYLQIARSAVLLREGRFTEARVDAEEARANSRAGSLQLEYGAALRALGEINSADGDSAAADANFKRSLEVFGTIQSQPELAQTLLAYGRFQQEINSEDSVQLLKRALALFEHIGAEGWAIETMASLRK